MVSFEFVREKICLSVELQGLDSSEWLTKGAS